MKYSLEFKLKMIKLKKERKPLEYLGDSKHDTFSNKVRLWE